MAEKLEIERLPVTDSFIRRKRLIQERGELALIEDGRSFRHLGYFSIKKGAGLYRGGHYHLGKVEHFYIVSGRILVRMVDLETGAKSAVELEPGCVATLHPNCAHRFEALEDAQVIEYYDGLYDPQDDHPFEDF
jgi:dTDP-4-dehydrorhamnose 3,5-epimerase-like enzyme